MCEQNNENFSLFKQVVIENKKGNEKTEKSQEEIKHSKRYKRQINRIQREIFESDKLIYSEADNIFERTRSKIVCWWNKHRDKSSQ